MALLQLNLAYEILFFLQIAIVLGLLAYSLVTISNLKYLRKLNSYTFPDHWPRFSVLVPARNEEESIAACVSGLLAQDYPDFQIMVLDDNSTDRTWDILQEFARKDSKLRLLKGKELPADWLGKHWACHQLAQEADGELLLFLDADTIHQPDMLRCSAAAMIGEDAALISALPRQHVVTWPEMFTIPAFYLGVLCGVPMPLLGLQRKPLLFACLGQFMLFRREVYEASGGHAAVRQNIVDDVAIGRRIHAMGLRYRLLDGNGQVACRMYHNFNQVWKGLTKSTFASFNFNPLLLISMWWIVLMIFIEPLVVLIIGLTVPQVPLYITAAAGLAALIALLLWFINNRRFHFPLYLIFIYPISALFMTVIQLASMFMTIRGKAMWKGRLMPKTVKF